MVPFKLSISYWDSCGSFFDKLDHLLNLHVKVAPMLKGCFITNQNSDMNSGSQLGLLCHQAGEVFGHLVTTAS